MRLFGIIYNICNISIYIYNAFLFSHKDFKQKRTHNMNAMYNIVLVIPYLYHPHHPNRLHQPDYLHLDPFSCMRHNYSGQLFI